MAETYACSPITHSLALKDRKIMLYDTVDNNSVAECLYYLYKLRELDKISNTKEPIDILVNSNGGFIPDGLSLVSLIELMKDEGYVINTINIGSALSMGFVISIVGTNRYAYRYSTYLLHDASMETDGKVYEVLDKVHEVERQREQISNIVAKYTKLDAKYIKGVYESGKDVYYSAEQALELGFADKII